MGRLKHRWSLEHNYLSGICFSDWLELLKENKWKISPTYAHRAVMISTMSILNECWAFLEQAVYSDAIEREDLPKNVVFILGHWRSGTTHLHNLLAQDTENFAFPNTYQVINPKTFLLTEKINSFLFKSFVPETRPMDNMKIDFQSPQEDEFAMLLMELKSLYLSVSFPDAANQYDPYLTFRNASVADTEAWKKALTVFLKKLSIKYPNKTILLKSPPHTARIPLIRNILPNAKFIHIHRHPEDVFRSFRKYYDTAVWFTYLQKPDRSKVDEQILHRYKELYEAYFDALPSIPSNHFHEVSYTQLEQKPMKALKEIYHELQIALPDKSKNQIERYIQSLQNYKKNQFNDLSSDEKATLCEHWEPIYSRFGYEIKP